MPLRLFLIILTIWGLNDGLTAQSYVRQFSPQSAVPGTAKVMHLDADRYLLFRTLPDADNDSKTNHLQIVEYDYCGIVDSREIHFEDHWFIKMFGDVEIVEDSIRIKLWSYSPFTQHQTPALLSIHPVSYQTSYKEIQGANVMYSSAITPYLDDQYIVHGFVSYIDRPTEYVLLRVDRNFEIVDYYQNYGSGIVAGGCVVRGSEIYFFTDSHIVKFTSELEPIWSKETHDNFYIWSPILLADGIAFGINQYGNELQLFAGKIDFNGNLLWQSNSVGYQTGFGRRNAFYKNTDGSLVVVKQERPTAGFGPIVVSNIDDHTGEVLGQWELDGSVAGENLRLQHFLPEPEGGVLCAMTSDFETVIVKYNLEHPDENCAMLPVDLQQASLPFSIKAENIRPNKVGPFASGNRSYETIASAVQMDQFCKTELPTFELLSENFSVCGGKQLDVDLSAIAYPIEWNDGSAEKIRTFSAPGKYSYTYEFCGEYFGEEIELTNEFCSCDWFIPNVFSPGNGTENDEFRIYNSCQEVNNFSILIYNRWGGLMFTSEDPNFRWDGTWKGKGLQSGVFSYLMNFEDSEQVGNAQVKQGTILLLR